MATHGRLTASCTCVVSQFTTVTTSGWFASPVDGSPSTARDSYLVDPASSHMLVSKIKPCMSKYKQIHTVKLRMAH